SDQIWRTAYRFSRDTRQVRAANARPSRWNGERLFRTARVRSDTLDARTAHPARESDIEHLHESVAVRADDDSLSRHRRTQRPAGNLRAKHSEDGLRRKPNPAAHEASRSLPCRTV